MTATPAITSSRPVCPIDIPTGNTTKKDKFDRLFRMLFNAGEPISMDAEETLAGLHNNGNWDAVWYTEASPYLIRVVVYKKDDDGNPGIEVSLSKKKPGERIAQLIISP
ncbi:MAG: hypothetical protein HYZ79_03835, partial [Candidatus Melainabacteria bacterium]|nr:hypothetical protein [Candidatus Melainabacteria bacterium]